MKIHHRFARMSASDIAIAVHRIYRNFVCIPIISTMVQLTRPTGTPSICSSYDNMHTAWMCQGCSQVVVSIAYIVWNLFSLLQILSGRLVTFTSRTYSPPVRPVHNVYYTYAYRYLRQILWHLTT